MQNFDDIKYIKCVLYFKKRRNLLSYFSPKIKEFDRDTSTRVKEVLVTTVLSAILVKQK